MMRSVIRKERIKENTWVRIPPRAYFLHLLYTERIINTETMCWDWLLLSWQE